MQNKISKPIEVIDRLDDLEIGCDPRPLTKRNKN
jgi:hypothetical protein